MFKSGVAGILFIASTVSCFAQAETADKQAPRQMTRVETCNVIIDTYKRALNGQPGIATTKNQMHDDLVGVASTVARHETLSRLLTIAWAQQCDMGPIVETERARVLNVYIIPGAQ